MDTRRDARLTVKLRLLSDPSLWCWKIVDVADDTVVESSWATNWTGYTSSPEAFGAGIRRLTDLTRGGRGAQPSWTDC
jgi:hypothetical protein